MNRIYLLSFIFCLILLTITNAQKISTFKAERDKPTQGLDVLVRIELDDDYGGVVMISYPTDYSYPEPPRIWSPKMNNRGDVYANFYPTKNMDWLLNTGQRSVLKYRFVVYNGPFTKEQG